MTWLQRRSAKKAVISAANVSGCSSAGKCPPRSLTRIGGRLGPGRAQPRTTILELSVGNGQAERLDHPPS